MPSHRPHGSRCFNEAAAQGRRIFPGQELRGLVGSGFNEAAAQGRRICAVAVQYHDHPRASMRPPLKGGGYWRRVKPTKPTKPASMRPPLKGGGYTAGIMTCSGRRGGFNEAAAQGRRISGCLYTALMEAGASMRPPLKGGGYRHCLLALPGRGCASMRPPLKGGGYQVL